MHETHGYSVSDANSHVNPHEGHAADHAAPRHLPGTEPIDSDASGSPSGGADSSAEKKPSWAARRAARKAASPASGSVSTTSAGKKSMLPWDIRVKIAVVLSFVILVAVLIANKGRLKGTPSSSSTPLANIAPPGAASGGEKAPDKGGDRAAPQGDPPKPVAPKNRDEKDKANTAVVAAANVPVINDAAPKEVVDAPIVNGNVEPNDPPDVGKTEENTGTKAASAAIADAPPLVSTADDKAGKPAPAPTDPALPPKAGDASASPPPLPVEANPASAAPPNPAKVANQEPEEPKSRPVVTAEPPGASPPAALPALSTPPPTPEATAPAPIAKPEAFTGEGYPIPNAGSRRTTEVVAVSAEPIAGGSPSAVAVDRKPAPSAGADDFEVHVVRRNENFWTISRYHYGSGRYYKALWHANQDLAKTPEDLYVGTAIRIPNIEDLNKSLIEAPRTARGNGRISADAGRPSPSARDSDTERTSAGVSEVVMLPVGDASTASKKKPAAKEIPRARRSTEPPYHTYVVRGRFETLRSIANAELGDSDREREILELNREVLDTDAKQVPSGLTLKIPGDSRRQ
ncbi:MAG: LysM protein [Planctomycetota bacterium]|nr:LysM protein [Planctomycetota bacterium]